MSFWSTKEFLTRQQSAEPIVVPHDDSRIKQGAYELSVEGEYYTTSMEGGKEIVREGHQIEIRPGQLAILITSEKVDIPKNKIGLISIKFSQKFRGLINVSGFHVDPGFTGKLKFSVYNAGSKSILFDPGKELFLLWICDMTSENPEYDGAHKNQENITAGDVEQVYGEVASPAQLKEAIKHLDSRVSTLQMLFLAALGAAIGPWAIFAINNATQSSPPAPAVQFNLTVYSALLIGGLSTIVFCSIWKLASPWILRCRDWLCGRKTRN